MLKNLTIRNYALISRLEINFPKGFSVMTGETGAGKSIIIGALSLMLGQRADAKSIKQNEDKCLIEGLFDIADYGLESFFTQHDLDYDPHNCILRREIWNSGKSRAFINDNPVGLNDLKDLGAFLIDIHSQHQNLLLGDSKFQLQVIDALAGNKKLRAEYTVTYRQFATTRKQLQELTDQAASQLAEQDYLRFQFQQLADAKLRAGEQAELEEELATLSHLEEIKSGLFGIEQSLSGEENGVVASLKNSLNTAQVISKIYLPANEIIERLQTAYLDLKDLVSDVGNQQEKLELDPERLKKTGERLDLIYSLQQKHRVNSVEELIELKNRMETQLQDIAGYDEAIEKLQNELEIFQTETLRLANELTETRQQVAGHLETQLVEKVSVLGMPYMQFQCQITGKKTPDATGLDDVNFYFSANKNVSLKPAAQIASGGEMSRLMLGIKALIADATALPTIIFDEIDTGISGEIADKMGEIMRRMGDVMQVIAITHLPQIAAKGNSHFFVYKEERDAMETRIRRLPDEERVREIAQMLSGSELTGAAIENAKELLK